MDGVNDVLVMLPAFLFSRRVDYSNPDTLFKVRAAFAVLELLMFSYLGYVWFQVKKKADKTKVKTKTRTGAEEIVTTEEYDLGEIKRGLFGELMNIGLAIFFQLKFGAYSQMGFRLVMSPYGMWKSPLFQIHVMGRAAEGKLLRPFNAGGLGALMSQMFGGGQQDAVTNTIAQSGRTEGEDANGSASESESEESSPEEEKKDK